VNPLVLELPATRGRVDVLDELKGLAILLIVVFYHAGGVLGWADVIHGEVGVDMFVVLSGIGLALGSQAESAGRYLARRFLRIYPAYWVALTACLVAGTYLRGQHFETWDIILHYTGMHVWFGTAHAMSINDSFWFITLIVVLYAVYLPLRRFKDRPDIILFAGAALAFTCAALYLHFNEPVPFANFSLRMPGFFAGLVIGRLMKTGRLEVRPTPMLGAAFLLVLYVPYVMSFMFTSPWIGMGIMAGYAFLLRYLFSKPARAALKWLGERSLEIFLIHQPLIREYNILVLQRYFPSAGVNTTTLVIGMAVALVVTLVVSDLMHSALLRLLSLVPARPAAAAPAP
jgi:peptidoglycan/LPS O-acetylase OafA/YrhL